MSPEGSESPGPTSRGPSLCGSFSSRLWLAEGTRDASAKRRPMASHGDAQGIRYLGVSVSGSSGLRFHETIVHFVEKPNQLVVGFSNVIGDRSATSLQRKTVGPFKPFDLSLQSRHEPSRI